MRPSYARCEDGGGRSPERDEAEVLGPLERGRKVPPARHAHVESALLHACVPRADPDPRRVRLACREGIRPAPTAPLRLDGRHAPASQDVLALAPPFHGNSHRVRSRLTRNRSLGGAPSAPWTISGTGASWRDPCARHHVSSSPPHS